MQEKHAGSRVGFRLREMVSGRGQSLKRFSEQVGIPYRSFQDYIAGKSKPGFEQLEKLARAGLDVGYLLSGRPTTNFPSGYDHEFEASGVLAGDNESKELLYHLLTKIADRAVRLLDPDVFQEAPTFHIMDVWARLVRHSVEAARELDRSLVDLRSKGVPSITVAEVIAEAAWARFMENEPGDG